MIRAGARFVSEFVRLLWYRLAAYQRLTLWQTMSDEGNLMTHQALLSHGWEPIAPAFFPGPQRPGVLGAPAKMNLTVVWSFRRPIGVRWIPPAYLIPAAALHAEAPAVGVAVPVRSAEA